MENSSLGGSCSGPTTLMFEPTHSFIQESNRKNQVGLGRSTGTFVSETVIKLAGLGTWVDVLNT